MADLIDRAAFIKSLCNQCDGWCDKVDCDCLNCKCEHRCDLIQELAEFPTVDAVEVPKDNVDDMNRAIIGLGIFRLSFCLNVQETDAQEEPVFRCKECPFEYKRTSKCAVKMFLSRNATEEQRNKFSPIV